MKRIDGVAHPTVTNDKILGFFQQYRFLSNFHLCEVKIQNLAYPSSEHAYQAMKFVRTRDRRQISKLATPREAKVVGSSDRFVLRPKWEEIRLDKMEAVLRCKFIQHRDLRNLLVYTGERYLEETNWWGDTYWGVCNGVGENQLGKLLMDIREDLQ